MASEETCMDIPLQRYWHLLVVYLRPLRSKVLLLALVLLGSISLQLLNPQILSQFIDTAAAGGSSDILFRNALLFLIAAVLNQFLSGAATYLGANVGWLATNRMRVDLADHCLRLDMGFHNDRTPGEMIERIDGDVTALSNFFSQFVVKVVGSVLVVIGVIILLFMRDWRIGLMLGIYSIVAMLVLNRGKSMAIAPSALEREASANLYGFIEERLAGIDDIRANGGGAYSMRRFFELAHALFHLGRRAWMKRSMFWVMIVGLFTVGDLMSLATGIYLFHLGAISLGTVYLFYQYTQVIGGFVEQITQQLQDMQKAGASIGRIDELFRTGSSMEDGRGDTIPTGPLGIEFDQLTFAYGETTILDSLSFELRPGTVLGLLGRTGSGKTTMTRLLFRLYDPTAGCVRLGGVDIRLARLGELRRRVAMVTQEVQLFHASVRDNLTFFNPEISDERIEKVIAELGLNDWYRSLPQGLDTELGASGNGLSAGESQLLAFTRVFLQDPGLVILDEPSSRMDLATERLLEQAMRKLLRGRTAIIIAHRLSTVARADEIMILDHGAIREHGRREVLARDKRSRFHMLLRTGMEHGEEILNAEL
jgi:ABC-type multidrug transport system fused ATPase/permease subunit